MMTAIERFNRNTLRETSCGCWIWIGTETLSHYGVICVGGKHLRAHRFSWSMHRGEIPKGQQVLHKCDIPQCVCPDHLFLGTIKDNMIDRKKKGRHYFVTHPENVPRGSTHPESKLTEEQVREIRQKRSAGSSLKSLASEYRVSIACISGITNRYNWLHVKD
jgi:hypothetical protein